MTLERSHFIWKGVISSRFASVVATTGSCAIGDLLGSRTNILSEKSTRLLTIVGTHTVCNVFVVAGVSRHLSGSVLSNYGTLVLVSRTNRHLGKEILLLTIIGVRIVCTTFGVAKVRSPLNRFLAIVALLFLYDRGSWR